MVNREETFTKAVRENERRIYGICCHYFGPGDDARDACQEILLKIWLNISGFRGESKISTWISRIAVNVCLTHIESNKRNSSIITRAAELPDCGNLYEHDSNDAEEEEKLAFFRDFTGRLNPVDRSLVSLYLEDIDYREIAQITGLSEVNARTRIHRIKMQIKKEWEEKNGTR